MAAEAAEQPVGPLQLLGDVAQRLLHQRRPARPLLVDRRLRDVVRPVDVRRLVDDQPVLADHVVDARVADRAELGQLLDRLGERRREPPHVGDHHGPARPVARRDDLLRLAGAEAHRLLDEHVDARVERRDRAVRVVLVAVEDDHAVQAAGGDHRTEVGVTTLDAVAVAQPLQQAR
jgi:hypothetical protein